MDLAKEVHRRCRNVVSEDLLIETYCSRLASLLERGLDREAAVLLERIEQQYPAARHRLEACKPLFAARKGDPRSLLAQLNDPSLSPERQAEVYTQIRRHVLDPRILADFEVLAADHPLRTAAAAVVRALSAVTAGPVPDEAIALPEIPRSSPLAPWKMLVRAIAAFYRRDDDLCRRSLAAIEPGAAAARLTPSLRALLGEEQTLTAEAHSLVRLVKGTDDWLRNALKTLDLAFKRLQRPFILQSIPEAVAACANVRPALLDQLRQHISVKALALGLNAADVSRALGNPSRKSAYFWRLLAHHHEQAKPDSLNLLQACMAWEAFRRHAVYERWFAPKGPEAAAIYLRLADLLRPAKPNDLYRMRNLHRKAFDAQLKYYAGQPPEIQMVKPVWGPDPYYLSTDALLERACEADPRQANYERWLAYRTVHNPDAAGAVAEQWVAVSPTDVAPCLYLMQAAEKRNALQKALKFMERAEKIDALNPEVRRARLRLLVSIAIRHLREGKARLAAKDLAQIEELPQSRQGDRPALIALLSYALADLDKDRDAADAAFAEAVRLLGNRITAEVLRLQVEVWCGRPPSEISKTEAPEQPLFAVAGRICAIAEDLGLKFAHFAKLADRIMDELELAEVADPRHLAALGEVALAEDLQPLAYLAAGVGLRQGPEGYARFLFMRARGIPPWLDERLAECLQAASELARRHHDSALLERIGAWRQQFLFMLDIPNQAAVLSSDRVDQILQRELANRALPVPPSGNSPFDDDEDDAECNCPKCVAMRGGFPELLDLANEIGPEAFQLMLGQILGNSAKKKKRRRIDSDLPF
jgi:hypothetical protein